MARRRAVEHAPQQDDLRARLAAECRARITPMPADSHHRAWLLYKAERLESGAPFYAQGWQLGLPGYDLNNYVLLPDGRIEQVEGDRSDPLASVGDGL